MSDRVGRVLLAAVGLLTSMGGCKDGVCTGTIEANGECRAADVMVDPASCGTGTILESGRCVAALPPMICDPQYTHQDVDPDTGVITCRSDCVPEPDFGCEGAFVCGNANLGKATLCGQLLDPYIDGPIEYDGQSSSKCGPSGTASSGPCVLGLRFFDADELAANPGGAVSLGVEEISVDECGRFRAVNIDRPSSGRIAVLAEDFRANPSYVPSGVAVAMAPGEIRRDLPVYVVSSAADNAWSTSAGIGSPNFSVRGAYLALFTSNTSNGVPVAGVQVTREGSVVAADDYYFSDLSAFSRTTIAPEQIATGANGAALLLHSTLGEHGGEGPEGSACLWSAGLGAATPGMFLSQVIANTGTGACP